MRASICDGERPRRSPQRLPGTALLHAVPVRMPERSSLRPIPRPQLRPHRRLCPDWCGTGRGDGRSEEHTSELQSLMRISYAVFCLKKKNKTTTTPKLRTDKQHTPVDAI